MSQCQSCRHKKIKEALPLTPLPKVHGALLEKAGCEWGAETSLANRKPTGSKSQPFVTLHGYPLSMLPNQFLASPNYHFHLFKVSLAKVDIAGGAGRGMVLAQGETGKKSVARELPVSLGQLNVLKITKGTDIYFFLLVGGKMGFVSNCLHVFNCCKKSVIQTPVNTLSLIDELTAELHCPFNFS